MNNHLRLQKGLRKRSTKQIAAGLPIEAQPHHIAPIAIAVKDKLADLKDTRRASNAARMVEAVFERSIASAHISVRLACGEACSSCCHLFTSATAPEILAIVRQLRTQKTPAEIEQISARCDPLIGKNVDERFGAKIPCPLLSDNRCSVYESRPLACRQCASFSRQACEAAFEGSNDEIPYAAAHIMSGNNAKLTLHAALEASRMV